jgi:hypothetical protein
MQRKAGLMTFKQALIKLFSRSLLLNDELPLYNNELAIFEEFIPFDAILPYIKYYTSSYMVPTINQTACLTVNFYHDNYDSDMFKDVMFDIAETLDNQLIKDIQKDDLRIYVGSNPVYLLGRVGKTSNYASMNFIIRGAINEWEVIKYAD